MFCLFMIIVQTMVSQYILQTTILLKALYHIWYYTPTNFIRKHSICSIVDILEKYHDIYAILPRLLLELFVSVHFIGQTLVCI